LKRVLRGLPDRRRRLELFDRSTERQRLRQAGKQGSRLKQAEVVSGERGWRRDDLYTSVALAEINALFIQLAASSEQLPVDVERATCCLRPGVAARALEPGGAEAFAVGDRALDSARERDRVSLSDQDRGVTGDLG
jgi:hypothetical protein